MQLLILNGAVVTLVVLSFLVIRRAPKPPVKLDLSSRAGDASPKSKTAAPSGKTTSPKIGQSANPQSGQKPVGWDNYTPRKRSIYAGKGEVVTTGAAAVSPQGMEKSLNIFFNWNGHAWDAYEVLGVPAGANIEMVYAAFERAKAQADRETLPFLSAAYEAVVNTYTLR